MNDYQVDSWAEYDTTMRLYQERNDRLNFSDQMTCIQEVVILTEMRMWPTESIHGTRARSRFDGIIAALCSNLRSELEEDPWDGHQGYRHEAKERCSPGYAKTMVRCTRKMSETCFL